MKQVAILTVVAAGLIASNAMATDGAYMGVQGGYSSIKAKQEGNLNGAGLSDTNNADGAQLGVYGGYGKTFNNVYLGAEVEANGTNNSMDPNYSGNATKFKQEYNYGAAARVGYNYNDCLMPYVRAGVTRAKFNQVGGNLDDSQTKTGFAPGVGLEYHVADHMSVRGELVSTYYGRMDSSNSTSGVSSKLNDRVARVGLTYNF
ncbi:MAG TPA: outer membrane beta-barrel protein [Alphaproteobacteria bacterium]|nr:outer membrane beta-barrel protein [Alphaproteobacteria bacterium]